MNGLDKTLVFVAVLDTLFVIAMIVIFCLFRDIPDTLVIAVFGATFGECGCCSYIWKQKRENQIKKEETDDRSDNIDNIYVNSIDSYGIRNTSS